MLQAQAISLSCQIVALEIMPDHVHMFLNCPPNLSPDKITKKRIVVYDAKPTASLR